jgi:hypothetical protein
MKENGMIWGALLHLGCNMWNDLKAADHLRCDDAVWKDVTGRMAEKGYNLVMIDLGEGIEYPSHPELAVKGSWSVEKLRAELERLRKIGLEPIPKLNFSTCHDAWLKEYGRMVSTPEYYKVCAELIGDVCELFDKPRFLHLGFDEENAWHQRPYPMTVIRQGDLWWHDLLFMVKETERHGVRPWVWSDKCWGTKWTEFERRMPRSVLQSNWYYYREFADPFPHNRGKFVQAYDLLDKAGFDQVPTCSNWDNDVNTERTVKYCREHISAEKLKGFLTAPWKYTQPAERDRIIRGIDQLGEFIPVKG